MKNEDRKIHFTLVKPMCSMRVVFCDDAIFNSNIQMFIFMIDGDIEYTHYSQIAELVVKKGNHLIRVSD